MVSYSDIDTALQDRIASTQNIKADSSRRMRAVNRALDKMSLRGNWLFTIRTATFSYDPTEEDYTIATAFSISDFKEFYTIDDVPIETYRMYNNDTLSVAVSMKNAGWVAKIVLDYDETTTVTAEYFSSYMCQTSGGTWQSRFVNTTDNFVGPADLLPVIVEMAYVELLIISKNSDKEEKATAINQSENLLETSFFNYGFTQNRGPKRIQVSR